VIMVLGFGLYEKASSNEEAFFLFGHNTGHQGELQILRDRGFGSNEMFLAMMARANREKPW